MFAPATQTVNAQSVTFGSIFKFYLGLTNRMSFLLLKFNIQNSMFKVVRLISFALIVQLRISATFSKGMKGGIL